MIDCVLNVVYALALFGVIFFVGWAHDWGRKK